MSSCSCGSSLSSDSLERRVPQHHLLDKARSFKQPLNLTFSTGESSAGEGGGSEDWDSWRQG